jgi:hypothetical protein
MFEDLPEGFTRISFNRFHLSGMMILTRKDLNMLNQFPFSEALGFSYFSESAPFSS